MEQIQVPLNFIDGNIILDTTLDLKQKIGFYCPFFLRSIKSHLNPNILLNNSTNVEDYELKTIRKHLVNNPAYMIVESSPTVHVNRLQSKGITITIDMDIVETISRYNSSFWQRLGTIWIQYLSIFIIIWKLIDITKDYIFTHQLVNAWEIIPWKKMY